MLDRINPIHLKSFIGQLIEDKSVREEVLHLIDRHIETTKSDKAELVQGIQQLLKSPEEGRKNAEHLIERFGKSPSIVFSSSENE